MFRLFRIGDAGIITRNEGEGRFHPAAAGAAAAALGDEEEALGGEKAEPARGAKTRPVGGCFLVVGPEGEAAIDPAKKESVAGADDGGAALARAEFVVEEFAVGERNSGGVGVDFVFVNNGVGDV